MIVTEELKKLIEKNLAEKELSDTEIRRIEGLGDMWISKQSDEILEDSESTYFRLYNIKISGNTYSIFGRK